MSFKTFVQNTSLSVLCITALMLCLSSSCKKNDPAPADGPASSVISVAEYPSYDAEVKGSGTADAGKTSWTEGDIIYLYASLSQEMNPLYIFQLTRTASGWEMSDVDASTSALTTPSVNWGKLEGGPVYYSACYAPHYEIVAGELGLKPGKSDGTAEFMLNSSSWAEGASRVIKFTRNYSRIRVATTAGYKAVLTCSKFIPASPYLDELCDSTVANIADANGNAFFYGSMTESSRLIVTVYNGSAVVGSCFLDGKTLVNGKSYALNPADKAKTIKLLAIGNSFSADAVEQELYPLFEAVGQDIIIGDAYIGGCPLEKHAANINSDAAAYSYRKIVKGSLTKTADVKLSTILTDESWDYVSVQEGAGFHGFYDATYQGTTHKMEPDLTTVINYVKTKCPGAKIIYHAPWVAAKTYTGVKFSYYGFDQSVMYSMICDATKQVLAAHPEISMFMNVMDAIQNARTSYFGDNMNRDGWHLNYTNGRYTAGCLWYEKIMGKSVVGNPYHPSTIKDQDALVCQTAAHEACLHPYTTADLSYFEKPQDDPEKPKKVLAKWYFSPDRAKSDGYIKTWCNQTELGVYTYSNKPGERGYMDANEEGKGKISYVQVDKTQWSEDPANNEVAGLSVFNVSNGGQPMVCGAMAGDYWLIETTGGYDLDEGSQVHFIFTYAPVKFGSQYWLMEYLDGSVWKPAFPVKSTTIAASGETISYNMSLTASKIEVFEFTAVLENQCKDFKVRMTCCSEYQVNGKWFNHPRTQSEQRIAGDPANPEKPLPEIDLIL